jgi:hypothetical protein
MTGSFASRAMPSALALIASLGLATAAQAASPNYSTVNYSVTDACSTPITVPVSYKPVSIMGVQTAEGFRGVGQVTIMRVPGQFLEWVGLDVASNYGASAAVVSSGYSAAAGTHIIWLDFDEVVDLQVVDAGHVKVCDSSTSAAAGVLTLMW